MKNFKTLITTLFIGSALLLSSCDNESTEVDGKGTARLEATDAAVDAENISGVFLSVREAQFMANNNIKASITYEEPQVFNLMDFQNGETFLMGETELDAGTYDQVRLILTSQSQAFVEFTNGTTQDIDVPSGSTSGYKINGTFEVLANAMSEVVVDVDLRKALVKRGNGEFNLRPTARLITKDAAGSIEGRLDEEDMQEADKVVVFAYLEGTFDSSEMNEPSEGRARFENSINSAVAAENGRFTLAFMPEGEYEIIVATFDQNELDGSFEFESATTVDVMIDGNLSSTLNVEARSVTNLMIDLF